MRNMGTIGRNFLAWHRQYLRLFEQRLQQVDSSVSVPYWDWISQPSLPTALSTPTRLSAWGVTRQWNATLLPIAGDIAAVNARTVFSAFQSVVEAVHSAVHNAVGGTMSTASSPADPIFWLHHANVDRLWASWQAGPNGAAPSNVTERMRPGSGFVVRINVRVQDVLDIAALGYSYA